MKVKFKRGNNRGYPVYVNGRQGKEQAFFPRKEDGRYCIDDFYFDSDGKSDHDNIYIYCKIPFLYSRVCFIIVDILLLSMVNLAIWTSKTPEIITFSVLLLFMCLILWLLGVWQCVSLNNHIKKLK